MSPNLRTWLFHIPIVMVSALTVWGIAGAEAAMTLCVGGLISWSILGSVIWSTTRIFSKKPIALTALSIVIKYTFIGAILLYVTQFTQWSVSWVGLGIGLILPTLAFSTLMAKPDDLEI